MVFTLRFIDSKISYITAQPIPNIYYVINDNNAVGTFTPFLNSDPTLAITATLQRVDGQAFNPILFVLDPVVGSVTVKQTSDITTIETYYMQVNYFYVVLPAHIVSSKFSIIILS